jgi:hypothetical protein
MSNSLTQAPPISISAKYGTQGMTPQEVFSFFSDPTPVINRARAAFLGNCDWILKDGRMTLVEWVVEQQADGTFQKVPISPPQNLPLVDNYTLWSWIQGTISIYCSVYFLLNKPDEPEDLATTISIDIALYLHDNWHNYNLNLSKYHTICTQLSDLIYSVLKASEHGDVRKVLTHVFQVTESTDHSSKGPQGPIEAVRTALGGK